MKEIFEASVKNGFFAGVSVLTGNAKEVKSNFTVGRAPAQFMVGSLTQILCTSVGMMLLTAEKGLNLNAPVAKYIPEFGEEGKDKVTLKQLLKHTSGLPNSRPYLKEGLSKEAIIEKICYEQLEFPPAFERSHSNLGFIIIGAIIEKISALSFEQFFIERIAGPLALAKKGPALGHTGLFSTPEDCWKIAAAILACYTEETPQSDLIIPKTILDEFIGAKARYKLGWEIGEPPLPPNTVGMVSDTSCALWIDLSNAKIIEIFTNEGNASLDKWFPTVYPRLFSDI